MNCEAGTGAMRESFSIEHGDVLAEVQGTVGLITLNRAQALNALSLDMVRSLTNVLLAWADDERVQAVALRGMSKQGAFGAFCAGGDIRFFHSAALAGHPALEDFFTEEYRLNHMIHHYAKPLLVFMDGVVMGGGMGLAQGASLRIATERTKMAMPETMIGLFPDVGGGYFLSRCAGSLGEYLGLTGHVLNGAEAVFAGLADVLVDSASLNTLWAQLPKHHWSQPDALESFSAAFKAATQHAQASQPAWWNDSLNQAFSAADVHAIAQAMHAAGHTQALEALHKRSPLMLAVTLEQIRRARSMNLSDELRMERDLVRHSFHPTHLQRTPAQSDTVEGIRALAVDKDHAPQWSPAYLHEVTPDMVAPFFVSPWPAHAHPLRDLQAPLG
jgi:enoyl-CoA hydratase/carnithine racemase